MPCYDPETHERPIRLESRVHELTAMLCALCQKVQDIPYTLSSVPGLTEWWNRHEAHDQEIAALQVRKDEGGWQPLDPMETGKLMMADDVSYGQDTPQVFIHGLPGEEKPTKTVDEVFQESAEEIAKTIASFPWAKKR